MNPSVIIVEKGLDPAFLKHLRRQQGYGDFRIFETLASALPSIREAGFQTDGLLFMGAALAVDAGIMEIMDPDRVVWIIDWKTEPEAKAEAELKGFSRWIFPDTQFVNATIILFTDPFAE